MVFAVATRSSCIDYEELAPNVTVKMTAEEILRRYRVLRRSAGTPEAVVFHADRSIGMKDAMEAERHTGSDEGGMSFLPWCLMRCAEAASVLSIGTVRVDCDRETWHRLGPSLDLIRSVTGVRLVKDSRP